MYKRVLLRVTKRKKLWMTFILMIPFFHLFSCSSASKRFQLKTPEGRFKYAEHLEKNRDYEQAIMEYQKVKNNHPYSSFSKKAELKIADIYYKKGSFSEAEVAYTLFRDLYPEHPRVDYVIFRLGMSHFKQAPHSFDRDLSSVTKALPYFDQIISFYKKSTFFKKAKEQKKKSLQLLSGKEEYIAQFYFKRKIYSSSLKRYEKLFHLYPELGRNPKSLFQALFSAYQLKEKDKFRVYYKELQNSYPQSKEAKKARRQFQNKLQSDP